MKPRPSNTRKILVDTKGNEAVQTILILGIGSLLLIGFNKFWNSNSHRVRSHVIAAISKPIEISKGDSPITQGNGITQPGPATSKNSDLDIADYAEFGADMTNDFRDKVIESIRNKLKNELPGRVKMLNESIAEFEKALARETSHSPEIGKLMNNLLSEIKAEGLADLQDQSTLLENHLKTHAKLSKVLGSMGNMFGMDEMFAHDRKGREMAHNPNTSLRDRYEFFEKSFGIAGDQLVSGCLDAYLGGNKIKPLNNLAISKISEEVGETIAAASFKHINNMVYWLWDNGYSPHPPAFPRDFDPRKEFKK